MTYKCYPNKLNKDKKKEKKKWPKLSITQEKLTPPWAKQFHQEALRHKRSKNSQMFVRYTMEMHNLLQCFI